jgi:hypothetical protein
MGKTLYRHVKETHHLKDRVSSVVEICKGVEKVDGDGDQVKEGGWEGRWVGGSRGLSHDDATRALSVTPMTLARPSKTSPMSALRFVRLRRLHLGCCCPWLTTSKQSSVLPSASKKVHD